MLCPAAADIYGPSEKLIGQYLEAHPAERPQVQVLTKFCCFGDNMRKAADFDFVEQARLGGKGGRGDPFMALLGVDSKCTARHAQHATLVLFVAAAPPSWLIVQEPLCRSTTEQGAGLCVCGLPQQSLRHAVFPPGGTTLQVPCPAHPVLGALCSLAALCMLSMWCGM